MARVFEQTAEWWDAPAPDGRRRADLYLWELVAVYGDVTQNGWGKRRITALGRFSKCESRPDGIEFARLESGGAAKHDPQAARGIVDDDAAIASDIETLRLKSERDDALRRYRKLIKETSIYEDLAADGRRVLEPVTPLCAPPKPNRASGVIHQGMVLNFADWHVDESVDAEIMEGLNFYDPPTFLRRLECAVDKTVLLAGLSERIAFDTLYVHCFGDFLTNVLRAGFEHDDAKVTASMMPMVGARFAASALAYAVRDLAAEFPAVKIRCVPGNHGRFTKGMAHKLPTENLDWLIYEWAKTMCADLPNVTWEIPQAWSLTCDVEGWGFFLNHGHSDAKGGFGGISWYSLVKSDTKRTALDVKLGRKVLVRQYGHMHQKADVERAGGNGRVRIEPSMIGGNEFPKEGMAGTYSEPGQSLLEVHCTEGLTAERVLNVRQHDLNPECRYDPLLDLL